jgi:hypothetical protein
MRDRTEQANRMVAAKCLSRPALLHSIARGLESQDAVLSGDCAEVMTEVAEERPGLVAPYARVIAAHLTSRTTKVRWEAAHALSLIATLVPDVVALSLPRLTDIIRSDPSVIARDHAADTIGNYAATSREAARAAFPILTETLTLWDGKQAAHALNGLGNVAGALPEAVPKIRTSAESYVNHPRGVVRKAARSLLKKLGEN